MEKGKFSPMKKILVAFVILVLAIQPIFTILFNVGNVQAYSYYENVVCYGNTMPVLGNGQTIESSKTEYRWNITYEGSVTINICEDKGDLSYFRNQGIVVSNQKGSNGEIIYLSPSLVTKKSKTTKKSKSSSGMFESHKYADYEIVYRYRYVTDWTTASSVEKLNLPNLTASYKGGEYNFNVTAKVKNWGVDSWNKRTTYSVKTTFNSSNSASNSSANLIGAGTSTSSSIASKIQSISSYAADAVNNYAVASTSAASTSTNSSYNVYSYTVPTVVGIEEKSFNISDDAKKAYINSLFKSALGRSASTAEQNNYAKQNIYQITHNIIFSAESNNRNNASNCSNTDFVKLCYKTILGRDADSAGLNTNVAWLNNRTN